MSDKVRPLLWIVGRFPDVMGEQWEVIGLFNDKDRAIAMCWLRSHFVAPLECNVVLNIEPTTWPGLFYPLAEGEP